MLQGLAINTIAVPKSRWYPNFPETWKLTTRARNEMTVEHPKVLLQSIDWYNLLGVGQSNVGNDGYDPWDWALGLSAAYSFVGLSHVVSTVAAPEKNWQHISRMQLDGDPLRRWTGLNTAFDQPDRRVETISMEDEQVIQLFEWLRKMDHKLTSSSIGWTGNLTLILPALNTICVSTVQPNATESFNITVPDGGVTGDPAFSVRLGSVASRNFSGATCTSTFRQALYPVNFWIVNMQGADASFNGFGTDWDKTVIYETTTTADYDIVHSLAIQVRDTLGRMEPMVHTATLLEHVLLISRMIQKTNTSIHSDAEGLSIVVSILLQNILSVSNKHRSPLPSTRPFDPQEMVKSYPLRCQLYGSGLRLSWEWITLVVLIVVVACFAFGIYQTLRFREGPRPWVELGGMMLAQTSPKLDDIGDKEKARKRPYWIDKGVTGGPVLKIKAC